MPYSSSSDRRTRWLMTLFLLPFLTIGLGMLFLSVLPTVYDWARMQSWQPVQAQLLSAQLRVQEDDDGATYRVAAQYRYTHAGQSHVASRVAISTSGDNVGDFQQQLGRRLEQALEQGEAVTAWVNPRVPREAVLDRSLRPGLLAFKLLFGLVFSAVGLGLLVFTWGPDRSAREDDTSSWSADAAALNSDDPEDAWRFSRFPGGARLQQTRSRRRGQRLILAATGAGFVMIGRWVHDGGAPLWFATLMGGAGVVTLLGALYGLMHSLNVELGVQGLRVEHCLLGMSAHWQQWPPEEITRLSVAPSLLMNQYERSPPLYRVQAHLRSGRTVTLADQLPEQAVASELLKRLQQATGYL